VQKIGFSNEILKIGSLIFSFQRENVMEIKSKTPEAKNG